MIIGADYAAAYEEERASKPGWALGAASGREGRVLSRSSPSPPFLGKAFLRASDAGLGLAPSGA